MDLGNIKNGCHGIDGRFLFERKAERAVGLGRPDSSFLICWLSIKVEVDSGSTDLADAVTESILIIDRKGLIAGIDKFSRLMEGGMVCRYLIFAN